MTGPEFLQMRGDSLAPVAFPAIGKGDQEPAMLFPFLWAHTGTMAALARKTLVPDVGKMGIFEALKTGPIEAAVANHAGVILSQVYSWRSRHPVRESDGFETKVDLGNGIPQYFFRVRIVVDAPPFPNQCHRLKGFEVMFPTFFEIEGPLLCGKLLRSLLQPFLQGNQSACDGELPPIQEAAVFFLMTGVAAFHTCRLDFPCS